MTTSNDNMACSFINNYPLLIADGPSLPELQFRKIQGSPHVCHLTFSNLTSNPSNIDSYEPNLIICEYLANRCQPSSANCLRKLNDLLSRKFKRDQPTEQQTQCIVKLNLAILLILQGRRDSALLILSEIYNQRDCFVEFMQSRIFLLLLVPLSAIRN